MRNKHMMLYDLHYLGIYVHIASNSHFGGLWGHGSLKTASMASDVKFELRFEVSIFNYHGISVHIASNCHFDGFWDYSDLQTASEAASDLTIELSDLNNLCCHASLASKCLHEMIADVRTQEIYHPLTCVASPQVKSSV